MRKLAAICALALSIPAAAAGCGGDDESSEDPQTVIDDTLSNDAAISSGILDITLGASAGEQGSFEASVSGPFQGDPDDPTVLPQLDMTGTVSGEGAGQSIDMEGGLVISEDNAFVEYQGETYEVGTQTFGQFKQAFEQSAAQAAQGSGDEAAASFKEQCEQAIQQAGGDTAACDFDVTNWFTNLSNEGTEDIEGTSSVHVSGDLDLAQMLDDISGLGEAIPGAAAGVDPAQIQGQLDQVEEAVSEASFDVYSTEDENLLNGLDLNLVIDPAAVSGGVAVPGVESVDVSFGLRIGAVNEEQTIEAPTGAKSIDELVGPGGLEALGGGIPGAGLEVPQGGDVPAPGGGATGDAYLDCVAEAKTPDEINACASEL